MLNEYVVLARKMLLAVCAFFWRVTNCAYTLEKYGSLSTGDRKRVASIASQALTLKPRDLHSGDTSASCGHPDAFSGNFGENYLIGSYPDNSLVTWVLC